MSILPVLRLYRAASDQRAWWRALWIACLSLLLPAAAIAAPDEIEDSDYWRVVEIDGQARMLAGVNSWNQEQALSEGDVVGPYQSVATDAQSTVILIRGEDIIVVHAATTISLPAPEAAHSETQIEQTDGTAFYAVDPRPNPQFAVQTEHLVAGVKGTEFNLAEDGARLQVLHGVVGTHDLASGDSADVTAGQGTRGTGSGTNGFTTAMLSESELAALRAQSAMIDANRNAWQSRAGALLEAEGQATVRSLTDANGVSNGQSGSAAGGGSVTASSGNALAGLETDLGAVSSSLGASVGAAGGMLGQSLSAIGGALGDSLSGNTVGGVTESLGNTLGGIGSGLGGAVGGLGSNLSGGSSGSGSSGNTSSSSGQGSSGSSGSGSGSSGSEGSGSSGSGSSGSGSSGSGSSESGSGSSDSGSSGSSGSGSSGSGGGLGGIGGAVGGAIGGLL